jgi:hypothetical protein
MKRKFAVIPIETLALEFPDGTVKEAVFNVESLIYLTEEFGDLSRLVEDEMTKPYELAAKILYSGMKVMDGGVTMEEAQAIVVSGGVRLMAEIMDMFQENLGEVDGEELKKNITPLVNMMIGKKKQ